MKKIVHISMISFIVLAFFDMFINLLFVMFPLFFIIILVKSTTKLVKKKTANSYIQASLLVIFCIPMYLVISTLFLSIMLSFYAENDNVIRKPQASYQNYNLDIEYKIKNEYYNINDEITVHLSRIAPEDSYITKYKSGIDKMIISCGDMTKETELILINKLNQQDVLNYYLSKKNQKYEIYLSEETIIHSIANKGNVENQMTIVFLADDFDLNEFYSNNQEVYENSLVDLAFDITYQELSDIMNIDILNIKIKENV